MNFRNVGILPQHYTASQHKTSTRRIIFSKDFFLFLPVHSTLADSLGDSESESDQYRLIFNSSQATKEICRPF
jgi:hypothetical protein